MSDEFRREFLVQLPLPLAQLYGRAYNAKDGRARHDNSFYCFEAAIKLAACPLIACYVDEVENGAAHNSKLDKQLAQIALPSLGQWVGFLRETSRYFSQRADSATHPLGHVWNQLNEKHRTLPSLLALYQRIKNGPDGKQAGDRSCSILQLLESIVQYRNLVFGHGAGRTESFYEVELGPLLFPALNDLFNDGVFDFLGPANSRLVFLTDLKKVDEETSLLELKELAGTQSTRLKPISLTNQQSSGISPQSVAVLWPSRPTPLVLEPLLAFREDDFVEEVLFVNCDRNNKHVEFLSYTTGRTEKNAEMAPLMVHLLSIVSGQKVTKTKIGDMQHASLLADAESNADAVPVEPPVSLEGRLIQGDFEILGEIGRGGMGVVYLARQLSLGRPVALKMLHPEMAGNAEALARFKREIATLARCDHPHIVKVLSAGKMPNGEYYYAMEYVSGSDLELVWSHLAKNEGSDSTSRLDADVWAKAVLNASTTKRSSIAKRTKSPISAKWDEAPGGETSNQRVEGGDTEEDEGPQSLFDFDVQQLPRRIRHFEQPGTYSHKIASMIRDAADGLQALHDRDIVHRDIKPSNMVLTADGSRVVLMDFGLAKSANQSMAHTRAGGFMGTLRYAAPEQLAASTMKVGPQADIRGLGVTMWELITRRQLFDDAHDEMQLAQAIIHRDVPLLRSVDPTIEADLEAIVARATERQLSDRLQTARQFVELLDLYLEGKPLPIRSPSRSELIRRQFKAYSLPVKLMAATAVIVLVCIAASIWQRNSSPSPPTKIAAAGDLELLTVTSFSGSSWLQRAPWLLPKLRGDISAEISKSQSSNQANDERHAVLRPVVGQESLLNSNASIMRSNDVESVLSHLQLGFSRHLSQTTGPTAEVLESLQAWDPREVIEDPQERMAIKDKILDGLKLIGDPHALAVYAAHFDQSNIETGIDPDLEFKQAEQAYKSQGDAAKGLLALCYADWAQYLATQGTHESRKHAANKFAKARETIVDESLAPLLFAECYCGEANARRKLRQWASVEECLRNAERITQEYAAEHHPLAAYIQERLAWQYMDQWKVLQAKTAFEKAITIWEYWDQRLANDDDGANDLPLTVSTSRFADEHGLAMVERYLGNNTEAIRRYSELPRQIRDLRNQQDDAAARLRLSSRLVNTKERLADCSLLQAHPQLKSAVLNYRQAIDDFPASQRGNQLQMPPTMLQYKRVIASILDLDGDQDSSASTLVGLKKELDEIEHALEAYEQSRQELTGKAYERDHLLNLYVQSAQLLLDLASNQDPATIESLRDLVDQEIARNSNENLKRDNLDLLLFLSDRILSVAMTPEDASRPFKLVPEVWRLNVLNYLRPYHDRALSALMTTGTTDLSVLADYISKAKTGQPLDDLNSKSIIMFYSAATSDSQLTIDSALIHHVDGSGQIVKLKQPIVIKSNDVDQELKSIPWPDELMIENSAGKSATNVHWQDDVSGLNRGNFPWLTTLPKNYVLIDSQQTPDSPSASGAALDEVTKLDNRRRER